MPKAPKTEPTKTEPIDYDALITKAAKKGAREALADLGIENGEAAHDVKELRSLLSSFRVAKQTMWQTVVKILTAGFLITLMTGAAIKLKLFGE